MDNRCQHGRRPVYGEKKKDKNSGGDKDNYKGGYEENYWRRVGEHDLAALAKTERLTVPTHPTWASAINRARCGRMAVTQRAREKPSPEDFLTSSGRPIPSFENKKDKDDNNGDGDDHNNGGSGANNRKEGKDRDGNGNKDKDKSSHDDRGGYTSGKNMDFMGEASFGYGYAYHAGYKDGYPVEQLQHTPEVHSTPQNGTLVLLQSRTWYTKSKNMDFMGEAGFGYGHADHADYKNNPVSQLHFSLANRDPVRQLQRDPKVDSLQQLGYLVRQLQRDPKVDSPRQLGYPSRQLQRDPKVDSPRQLGYPSRQLQYDPKVDSPRQLGYPVRQLQRDPKVDSPRQLGYPVRQLQRDPKVDLPLQNRYPVRQW